MTVLVVGGSSGLGLELVEEFVAIKADVIITGRKNPKVSSAEFKKLDLNQPNLAENIDRFVEALPEINALVYAAGFYQEGTVTDLTEKEIEAMINVGGRGLIYLVRAILKKQDKLDELITITSSSQWTPRKLEPIYNFVKAGGGHLTNSLAEDGRIKKVMVVAPSGMKTKFWRDMNQPDWEKFLDPEWVSQQIMTARSGSYRYKCIKILRDPKKVEEVEKR